MEMVKGKGKDTKWHDWKEIVKLYPNCYVCLVNKDTGKGPSLEYPPEGGKVWYWNQVDGGDYEPIEDDRFLEELTKEYNYECTLEMHNTNIQTEKEYYSRNREDPELLWKLFN